MPYLISHPIKSFYVDMGSTHPQYSIFTFNEEEKDIKEKFWKPGAGDIVFDIGSSYGGYSLPAVANGASVWAFEPEPTVFKDLLRNVELNKFQDKCSCYCLGFWDREANFSMAEYAPHWPPQGITQNYSFTSLDKFIDQFFVLDKINWMKIDVEGAEEKVLLGGLETLKKFHPKLLIECHDFLDKELSTKVENILTDLGYFLQKMDRDPCIMIYAE